MAEFRAALPTLLGVSGAATAAPARAALRIPGPALGAFAAYFAIALFNGSQEPEALAGLCLAVAAGVTAVAILAPRPFRAAGLGWTALAAMLVFALLVAGSSAWASDDGRVYVEAVRALAYLGALSILVFAVRTGQVRQILAGVAAAIAAIAALAVASRLLPGLLTGDTTFLREFPADVRGRLSYPIGYWNGLAACMAGGVVLVSWFGAQAPGPRGRAAAIAAMPVLLLAIYLSGSRGGLLAALVGVVVLLALTPVRGRLLAGLAIGGCGGLVLALATASSQDLVEGTPGRSPAVGVAVLLVAISLLAYLLRYRYDAALRLPRLPRLLEGRWLALLAVLALVGLFLAGSSVERVGDVGAEKVDNLGRGQFSGRFLALGSNGRLDLWRAALDAFESEPVHGIGAGAFGFWWNQHGRLSPSPPAMRTRSSSNRSPSSARSASPRSWACSAAGFFAVRRLTFGDRDGLIAALARSARRGSGGRGGRLDLGDPGRLRPQPARDRAPRRAAVAAGSRGEAGRRRAPAVAASLSGRWRRGAGAAVIVVAGALLLAERDLARSRELAAP